MNVEDYWKKSKIQNDGIKIVRDCVMVQKAADMCCTDNANLNRVFEDTKKRIEKKGESTIIFNNGAITGNIVSDRFGK